MTTNRFCLKRWTARMLMVFGLALCASGFSVLAQAQTQTAARQTINNHYMMTVESLEFLRQRLATQTEARIAQLPLNVAIEDYIAGLNLDQYSQLISTYARSITDDRLRELATGDLSHFYNAYVDWLYEDEYAVAFRQYLGELTSRYLVAAPAGTTRARNFSEYVLQEVLQLSDSAYSNLYRDYIETLWRYYLSTATDEELIALLGDDFDDPVASAGAAIADEKYFSMLADHITAMDEAEFIANYRAYVTETIGGIIERPEILDSVEQPASQDPAAAAATDGGENAAAAASDTTTAADAAAQGDAVENRPLPQIPFFDLTMEGSLRLIRQHIASVAMNYFIADFKDKLINSPYYFTSETSLADLSLLTTIPDFRAVIQESLNDRNARNQATVNALNKLTDDTFLGGVRLRLRFVEGIPYPNMRLLQVAVLQMMTPYRDGSDTIDALPPALYDMLLQAIMDSAVMYDLDGPVLPPSLATTAEDVEAPATEVLSTQGAISWDFLGCGCEIDPPNVIYGFYPAWDVPKPGDPVQQIDLRFYSRVAYFGFTLNGQGGISNDDYWREGGVMNTFIQDAHVRNTFIDLAVYSPSWHEWGSTQIAFATANVVDKLSIPLEFDFMSRFASNYLRPIYPTSSETIGKVTMGDGLTLYFDELEDESGAVRDLETIVEIVTYMSNTLNREFPEEPPPINLMLDFRQENTEEVLTQLRSLIVGTEANMNQYVSRVLIFLEQDTWDSSQHLIQSIRSVFKEYDSGAVLRKMNPIIIPAMDENDEFPALSRDLRDMRWTFGNAGGAAIWPIPLADSEKGLQIERAFTEAMVEDSHGLRDRVQRAVRSIYFQARLSLIFTMTGIYLLSILILIWSIREPIKPWILMLAKVMAFLTFTLFMVSAIVIDPYINMMRIAFFLLPLLFVVTVVPLQSSVPDVRVNPTGNRYVNRAVKRQKSRAIRKLRGGVRKAFRQGLWGGGAH